MAYVILILISLLSISSAWANSCCGQSPASFSILSLEQQLSVSTSYSYLDSQGRVLGNNTDFLIWDDKKRQVQSLSVNVASTIASRHQLFVNASLLRGHYQDIHEKGSSTNTSDTLIGYSYEAIPEFSFSYWKPVVYVTALINLPTGHSIYDQSNLSEGSDVSGHNQWGTGLGLTLRKVYFPWTLTLQGRSIALFSKQFSRVRVSNFYDSSVAFLVNYSSSWFALQLNSGITITHLSERTIAPSGTTSGASQNFAVLAGVQRSISDSLVAGLNYSDQTLIGPAKNTILNRSLTLSLNYTYF